jgi:hypothetical protein
MMTLPINRSFSGMVARASRPSNPASRRISSTIVHHGLSAQTKASPRLLTVLGGTPKTTGQRPVPPRRYAL